MRQRDKAQALLFLSLCLFTAVNLMPVIWGVLTSIKQPVDAFSVPPKLIFAPTFEFHWQVWIEKAFWHYLINSIVISVCTVITSVSIGTMAAYGLSRMRNQASRGLLFGLLAMRMFPHILLAIPFFVLAKSLGLINTYPAMVLALVAINQPFTIWLMRSFFVDVPHELYEAAAIDGCSAWQVFARVALPVVRPGLWVTALFSLLLAYNEFLFALVLTGPDTKTLPVAIAEYGGEDINYWSLSAAAAVGIMLPIVAFMMALQRHLVRGLALGAIKGCSSGGNQLGTAKQVPVHRTPRAQTQTLIGERCCNVAVAGAHRRLGQGPVNNIALRIAAADAPEFEPHRKQQIQRLLVGAAMKCSETLDQRNADVAITAGQFGIARGGFTHPAKASLDQCCLA